MHKWHDGGHNGCGYTREAVVWYKKSISLQEKTLGNNTKNSIDINGKRYDAISGAVLQSVDGFHAGSLPRTPAASTATTSKRTAHTPAAHIAPHKPQKAATLMRSAVRKPDLRARKLVAQSSTHSPAAQPLHQVAPKLSHTSIDPVRQKRATRVMQSPAVSRYGNLSTVDAIAHRKDPLIALTPQTPQTPPPAVTHTQPTPAIPVQPIRHITEQPDIFEQALARATSHEQVHRTAPIKKPGRLATVASVGLVVVLAVGIFAYFNAPELSLRLASSRAGFEAQLPNYSPAGFTFGNLTYSPGNVTVSYKDGGNENRRFDITQRVSDWDSEGLLSNFVSSAASAYQTYERAGRTVYLYGNNTATWVDSGIWYTIEGSNSLTKNQVLDMAGSL